MTNFEEITRRFEEIQAEIMEGLQELTDEQETAIEERFHNLFVGKVYVGEDCIALIGESTRRNWNYYAGFEYINDEYITSVGDLHIYNMDNERVFEVLELLEMTDTYEDDDEIQAMIDYEDDLLQMAI